MEQRGQESQLERCPPLHSRNSFQDSLGRSGESDHEEQEEIWGLEMMKGVNGQGKWDLISAALPGCLCGADQRISLVLVLFVL